MNRSKPNPIYTPSTCSPSYRLNWALTLFWKEPITSIDWIEELKTAVALDNVKIIKHQTNRPRISLFYLSTGPSAAPRNLIKSVKGRLQHIIRNKQPKAFQRNYYLHSIGRSRREIIERYVKTQLNHHRMADPKVQAKLDRYQIKNPTVDLSRMVKSSHGIYIYNLHLVLVNAGRWNEIRDEILVKIKNMISAVARKKDHRLSAAGIFPDHIHIALGANISESPEEIALAYLNNLAYVQGQKPVYQFGYYAGTFGEYDTGAIH